MSYAKAMKHHANTSKRKKQATMHFGFSAVTVKETPLDREAICLLRDISTWFKSRAEGCAQYNRECIREAIQSYRALFIN